MLYIFRSEIKTTEVKLHSLSFNLFSMKWHFLFVKEKTDKQHAVRLHPLCSHQKSYTLREDIDKSSLQGFLKAINSNFRLQRHNLPVNSLRKTTVHNTAKLTKHV